ncbi:T9SS type A sorting domain-containing protein [Pontibacter qinzhouensis]|uniref:T9SS type A sorting domain-containing protein n=1 Tax=Pontibacter qinzhouensis TaxID=2603253 RepID=A0A5C8KAX3_9BACT|nr:T9SS type A sorting domain-containing protein [Pontibacter qinzhouensis]TXK52094.1 T9SS type A sorting domain-containing protein [Pontibacter qinzhouensis]
MNRYGQTFTFLLIVSCFLLGAGKANGQTFYDPFEGTGDIGGATETQGTTNNGWTTHRNSKAGIIPIVEGSLRYAGLQEPIGNKVLLPGDNANVSRDVSVALNLAAGTTVVYYAALVEVIDRTQLSATTFDYFMHLGSSSTTHQARLGIKSVNARNNFRLSIQNSTGGSPDQTEFPMDLAFGTTYLVVVKYDFGAAGNSVATLWVNPTDVGGAEPAGGVANSSGTAKPASIAIVSLRNGINTPKAHIDEVRVGTTWAAVTPAALVTSAGQAAAPGAFMVYPNPAVNGQPLQFAFPEHVASQPNLNLSVWAVDGRLVFEASGDREDVQKLLNTNMANISNGLFIIKVQAGKELFQAKVIKK